MIFLKECLKYMFGVGVLIFIWNVFIIGLLDKIYNVELNVNFRLITNFRISLFYVIF